MTLDQPEFGPAEFCACRPCSDLTSSSARFIVCCPTPVFRILIDLLVAGALMVNNSVADDQFFQETVAPILAKHCAHCHNRQESKGDFSVQDATAFFAEGYVEPGDGAASHLLDLISAPAGGQPEMPKSGAPLTAAQIKAIEQWVDAGASWPDGFEILPDQNVNFDWWSYRELQRPVIPTFPSPAHQQWVRTPVDAFVLEQLHLHQLSPSPPADRRTLIRRLSYDLTGLPPTADAMEKFLSNDAPDAYEQLVEQYLASPRYGERWARHWLDVVKYADTCGYDKDKLRPNAWPYRDYVIRSINQDKPYRQFVEEQIAGDVLHGDSPDGILGLGFIAAGPWDFIGHVEVPESKIDGRVARNLDRDDMVSNAMNTFCSVTIQCARCHDHKFDPFTQEHYYGLQAVFAAVDRADRIYDSDPDVYRQRRRIQESITQTERGLAKLEQQIAAAANDELQQLDAQIHQAQTGHKQPEFGYHSQIATNPGSEKWVEVEFESPQQITQIVLRPCHDEFNGIGAGFGFPIRFRIEADGKRIYDQTELDFPNPGLDPVSVSTETTARRIRVTATKLAERKNDYIFALAELQILDQQRENVAVGKKVNAADSIEAPIRWRKSNLVDGIWYEPSTAALESLQRRRNQWITQSLGQAVLVEQSQLSEQLAVLKRQLAELPPGNLVYAAATSFQPQGNFKPTHGQPRDIRLLNRGNVTSPGEPVSPSVIPLAENERAALDLPPGASESERRAALATWITRDDNPLTWRSIVNRVWQYHFGNGIVETPNDFGRMGGLPSHPALLDWLAIEFRDGGGSLKDLHRLIVTSSTYRQISDGQADAPPTSQGATNDSANRWLWKFNRRRLSAEEIRDSILQVSGQLELKMGGPGFYLFALEKTEHSPHYEYHKFDHLDPNSYRRSIYRFIVRSQPDPYMTTLDCADSSQSTPARNETQTPLQSLTMLNSDFNLVMSRKFADQIRGPCPVAGGADRTGVATGDWPETQSARTKTANGLRDETRLG